MLNSLRLFFEFGELDSDIFFFSAPLCCYVGRRRDSNQEDRIAWERRPPSECVYFAKFSSSSLHHQRFDSFLLFPVATAHHQFGGDELAFEFGSSQQVMVAGLNNKFKKQKKKENNCIFT